MSSLSVDSCQVKGLPAPSPPPCQPQSQQPQRAWSSCTDPIGTTGARVRALPFACSRCLAFCIWGFLIDPHRGVLPNLLAFSMPFLDLQFPKLQSVMVLSFSCPSRPVPLKIGVLRGAWRCLPLAIGSAVVKVHRCVDVGALGANLNLVRCSVHAFVTYGFRVAVFAGFHDAPGVSYP